MGNVLRTIENILFNKKVVGTVDSVSHAHRGIQNEPITLYEIISTQGNEQKAAILGYHNHIREGDIIAAYLSRETLMQHSQPIHKKRNKTTTIVQKTYAWRAIKHYRVLEE